MTKFSIGDTVRVTKTIKGDEAYIGKVVTLTKEIIEFHKIKVEKMKNYWCFEGKNYHIHATKLSLVKPRAKKEKTLRQEYARTRKVLKNAFREVEEETKKEKKPKLTRESYDVNWNLKTPKKKGKIEKIDVDKLTYEKTGLKGLELVATGLIVVIAKLNELVDAFNSTQEEGKR